jgi:2-dehydropantoate 2-reductase
MHVVIVGAGAVGSFVGAVLAAHGHDVALVGRSALPDPRPLAIDLHGKPHAPTGPLTVTQDLAGLSEVDVCIVAVKSQHTVHAANAVRAALPPSTTVVSLQNGLDNVARLRAALGPEYDVVAGMMTFNVIPTDAGFRQATAGPLVFGPGERADSQRRVQRLRESLQARGFDVRVRKDMPAVQLGKLLLNLNNGLCALTGLPLAAMLADRVTRTVFADAIREGLAVARAAGRPVGQLGVLSPRLVAFVLGLPDAAFFRISRAMLAVDPAAKTSTLQDLERGRLTEIDELNGAIAALASAHGVAAPINALISRGVHELEAHLGAGPLPYWSPATLRERVAAARRVP